MLEECIKKFDLESALSNYEGFDEREKIALTRLKRFVSTNNSCIFDRANKYGHITGSGFLFNKDLSKVLLTHHKKIDRWLQFGGHSDGDSNTLRVAVSEIREESGILDLELLVDGIFDVDIHLFKNRQFKEESHWHFDIRFAFKTNATDFVLSDESIAIDWFAKEQFFAPIFKMGLDDRFLKKWDNLLESAV